MGRSALTARTGEEPVGHAIERLATSRRALAAVLEAAPHEGVTDDERRAIERLIVYLLDPDRDRTSLAALATTARVPLARVLDTYVQGRLHHAQAAAKVAVAADLPQVAADTMRRAVVHQDPCTKCDGRRLVGRQPCPACAGTGHRLSVPTVEGRRLALELGGLLPKSPGVVQTQTVQAVHVGSAAGFVHLQRQLRGGPAGSGWAPATPAPVIDADESG